MYSYKPTAAKSSEPNIFNPTLSADWLIVNIPLKESVVFKRKSSSISKSSSVSVMWSPAVKLVSAEISMPDIEVDV